MQNKYFNFWAFCFLLLFVACKAKQTAVSSVVTDSVSKEKTMEKTSEKISLKIKYPMMVSDDVYVYNDSVIHQSSSLDLSNWDSTVFGRIPFLPGMEISIDIDKNKIAKGDRIVSVQKTNKTKEVTSMHKNNLCQYVMFLLIFLFFLCLVVKFRKKIANLFGAYRK